MKSISKNLIKNIAGSLTISALLIGCNSDSPSSDEDITNNSALISSSSSSDYLNRGDNLYERLSLQDSQLNGYNIQDNNQLQFEEDGEVTHIRFVPVFTETLYRYYIDSRNPLAGLSHQEFVNIKDKNGSKISTKENSCYVHFTNTTIEPIEKNRLYVSVSKKLITEEKKNTARHVSFIPRGNFMLETSYITDGIDFDLTTFLWRDDLDDNGYIEYYFTCSPR